MEHITHHVNFPLTSEEKHVWEEQRKQIWLDTAIKLAKLQQIRKSYEAEEKQLAEALKSFSCDKTTTHGDYAYIKSVRNGSVDYTAIPELSGVDLDKYRKAPVTQWKLEYLGEK